MNKHERSSIGWVSSAMLLAALGCAAPADENEDDGNNLIGASGMGAGISGASGLGAGISGGASGVSAGSAGTIVTGGQAGVMPAGTGGAAGTIAAGSGAGVGEAAGMAAGSAGMIAGVGGASGVGAGMPASGAGGAPPMNGEGCTPAPSGTFQVMTIPGSGPDGNYTLVRPTTLGEGGFLHPPVAWGNGLGTVPSLYAVQLEELASHGFVVIANPGTGSNPQVVRQGLEWLIAEGESGEFAGKLAKNCAGTIGYSMGGGAAVGSGSHPEVRAIVSIHGLQDAADRASGPILLLTSEGDTFVTKSGFVEPCWNRSTVQPTILASHAGGDHLDPLVASGEDWAPSVAWLRYWLYGDDTQKDFFFGDSCQLCDWPDFRRKNHPEWN